MTPKQVAKLVSIASANFPSMQDKNLAPTAELWHQVLRDIPYLVCEAALVKVLSTAKYFPTVAEVRESAVEIVNQDTLTAAEAWAQVLSVVKRYGFYRREEALESFQPVIKKAVKYVGWKEICHNENQDIIRAHFTKAYDQLIARERKKAVVPNWVNQVGAGAQRKSLPLGG